MGRKEAGLHGLAPVQAGRRYRLPATTLWLCLALLIFIPAASADTYPAIDDDYDGTVELWLEGCDADNDGYGRSCTPAGGLGSGDCDDNNFNIRPSDRQHMTGCSGGEMRRCKADGTGWEACHAFECPATGSGVCKFFADDAPTTNTGDTIGSPWPLSMISDFNASTPAGRRVPVAGDAYFLLDDGGTFDDTFTGTDGCQGDNCQGAMVFGCDDRPGTASDPIRIENYGGVGGENAVVDLSGVSDGAGEYWWTQGCAYWRYRGIELSGGGLMIDDDTNTIQAVQITDMVIHNHDGEVNDNMAGIYLGLSANSSDILVGWNHVYDNYEVASPGGNGNFVWFLGCDATNHDNKFIYNRSSFTSTGLGRCFFNKHAEATCATRYEFAGNMCVRSSAASNPASLWSAGAAWVHHNINLGCGTNNTPFVRFGDPGGTTSFAAQTLIEHNTSDCGAVWQLEPETTDNDTKGEFVVRNNVMVDLSSVDTFFFCDDGVDDVQPDWVPGLVTFQDNCYYTPSKSYVLNIFGDSPGSTSECIDDTGAGTGALLGARYTSLANAQAAGFESGSFDKDSTVGAFDSSFRALSPDCDDRGWRLTTALDGAYAGAATTLFPRGRFRQ